MHQRGSCGPEAAAVMVMAEPQTKDADCAGLTEPSEDVPCMSQKGRKMALKLPNSRPRSKMGKKKAYRD